MKDYQITILVLIPIFVLMALMGFVIYFFSSQKIEECRQDPRSCKTVSELKCEDAGGLYYRGGGGIFSASPSNCVFPPK